MDWSIFWRAAVLQAASVAAVSIALALALPDAFFERWGWLAGPGAWAVCAAISSTVLRLPLGWAMLGAMVAGLPSLLAVLAGVHWLGAAVAVAIFALWCGRLAKAAGVGPLIGRTTSAQP